MTTRPAYPGTYRKLVLAFDIGTTYSGISYSILDPGIIPETKCVTRFPAQEQVGSDSKIPTIIYYKQDGTVAAVGAEAAREGLEDRIDEEGWTKAEWFKLHMRPRTSVGRPGTTHTLPPLPGKKTVVEVFADFMRYLYKCARTYIQDTHANGANLWASIVERTEFVLTHPNGWEGTQQSQMRKAAVLAGLIPDTEGGHSRVHFVTEGEASLHFCIQSGLTTQAMENGGGVLIVDAGGGTIDLSAYGRVPTSGGHTFEEIASPQCYFQGSIFVTNHARAFLEDLLCGSKFSQDVDHITKCFDKTTKLRFRNINEPQYIKFGTPRDKDLKLNIRSGQLKLLGTEVATFFEPSTSCIIKAIVEQRVSAKTTISSVFLVGGFAASDWLFSRLKTSLELLGIDFCRPDTHVNKAVADGAISFYIDHSVTKRVSKYAYGVECSVDFDSADIEHLLRSSLTYTNPAGDIRVPRGFDVILPKNIQVSETTEFKQRYHRTFEKFPHDEFRVRIICYRGISKVPLWTDIDSEMYSTLCTVVVDLSGLERVLKPQRGRTGKVYYRANFTVVLSFGLTELTAQARWKENGLEKRCPAKIVYDDVNSTS